LCWIFPFKLADGRVAGFDDSVPNIAKVFQSLLELTGSEHYKFGGGHCGLQWNHVSSFREVKQQKGLNPMGYIICGMPKGLVSSDPLIIQTPHKPWNTPRTSIM
jgi:hypothetical protein